ncbi:hypothetical protein [Nocardia wallacei]|uniref:hypothetical protein n=1 Tax=Nocardia wallacei TaxID=480035 RepID=UPI0024587F19|nr:hypothetical protein [Nocardia wallacei]
MLGWLARTLTDRHGVEVSGFDLPGLDESAVREFVAAVDRVLTDYPAIVVDLVAVADLGGDGAIARWERRPGAGRSPAVRSITLDEGVAREPRRTVAATSGLDVERDDWPPADLPIYAATVREFASALDSAGGGVVGRSVQRILIAEYLRSIAGRYTTLGEVVRGYRRWRAELTGDTGDVNGFDVRRALGRAFADVVLHGGSASVQARVVYEALMDAVSLPQGRGGD